MSQQLLISEAASQTTAVPGRSLNSARTNHFIIDAPAFKGGPEEAVTPAEVFLAGICSCGVLIVESAAQHTGVPLQSARASIRGIRTQDNPANFHRIELDLDLYGVTSEQADRLVKAYTDG